MAQSLVWDRKTWDKKLGGYGYTEDDPCEKNSAIVYVLCGNFKFNRFRFEDAMAREKSFMYGPSTSNSVCQNKAILGLE